MTCEQKQNEGKNDGEDLAEWSEWGGRERKCVVSKREKGKREMSYQNVLQFADMQVRSKADTTRWGM